MPLVRRWHSRDREPPAPDHNLTRLVALSSTLSYRRASEGASLLAAAMIGYWQSPPEVRSQYPRWYTAARWLEGPNPSGADGLASGRCAVDDLLSWGHRLYGKDFLRKVFEFLGERS